MVLGSIFKVSCKYCLAIEAVSDELCEQALSLEKARSKTDADHTAKINVQYDIR